MRQAVKLYGYQFDPYGELDRSEANSKVIRLCNIDLTNAVSGTDYDLMTQTTSSFRGKTVRVIDFRLLSGHFDRLTGYDISGKSDILPRWECTYDEDSAEYQFSDCKNFDAIPIGEKPADWEWRWRDKYYTIYTQTFTYNNRTYKIRAPEAIRADTEGGGTGWDTATWSATTQYYKPKSGHEPQKMWFTDRLLCVSGSNMYETNGFGRFDNFGVLIGKRSRGRYWKDGSNLSVYNYLSRTNSFCTLNQSTKKLTGAPTWNINTWQLIWGASYTPSAEKNTTAAGFMTLCSFQFNGVDYVGIVFINRNITTGVVNGVNVFAMEDLPDENESPWGIEPELPPEHDVPYNGKQPVPTGGYGSYDYSSDWISRSDINGSFGVGQVGFLSTYVLTKQQLSDFFDEILDTTSSTAILDSLTRVERGIIDCWAVPIKPSVYQTQQPIRVLGVETDVYASVLSSDQTCTPVYTLTIDSETDTFLDYAPYSKCSIYLPFIGEKEIPINEIRKGTLNVYYIQDNITGDLCASVQVVQYNEYSEVLYSRIIAEFTSNAKYTVPLTAESKNFAGIKGALAAASTMVSSMMGGFIAASHGSGGMSMDEKMTNGAAGATVGGALALPKAAITAEEAYREPPVNGTVITEVKGNSGWLACKFPILKITVPISKIPVEVLERSKGFATCFTSTIGALSGFTVVKNVPIDNVSATDTEKNMILDILTSGFYA